MKNNYSTMNFIYFHQVIYWYIPGQTDQGFNWQMEVVNAVEGLSKVVV